MVPKSVILKPSFKKTLSVVEADATRSNQHEFNGVQGLKKLFGLSNFSKDAVFSIENTPISCVSGVTWYEAREAHETRSEYRLYFKANIVMDKAVQGDDIVIGFDEVGSLHCKLIKNNQKNPPAKVSGWNEVFD